MFLLRYGFPGVFSAVVLVVSPAWGETSADPAALVLLAREPISVQEIRDLAATDDVFVLDFLDTVLSRRLILREGFAGGIVPLEVDAEAAEALRGIEKLASARGSARAREILNHFRPDSLPGIVAREILARRGEPAVIREGLSHYFEQSNLWGAILGESARSANDPRLMDFRELGVSSPQPPSPRLYRSQLELNLARSKGASTVSALLYWAAEEGGLSAARILSRISKEMPHDAWINLRLAVLADLEQDGSETGGTRLHALDGLGRRTAYKHISVLLKALHGEDPVASAVAAQALGRLGHREAVPDLRRKLVSSEEPLRSSVVGALVELGGKEEALRLAQEIERWRFRASVPVIEALQDGSEGEARATVRVVRNISDRNDRLRAIRLLVEQDSSALDFLDLDPFEVNQLYSYLAQSRSRRTRGFVSSATGEFRGPALAALLISPEAMPDEKEKAVRVLGEAWPEAVRQGGRKVALELGRLAQKGPTLAAYGDPEFGIGDLDSSLWLDTLTFLPGDAARHALERLGTSAAIERLMQRDDRLYSISALGDLRRNGDREVQEAAERALLTLGAPGGMAIMQRKLARPQALDAMVPALPHAPLAIEAFRFLAGGEGPRPDVSASLFAYHQLKPGEFLPLLSLTQPVAHRRVLGVVALSGNPARMPLLVDLAVHGKNAETRRVALYALADADLEGFSTRLHRAAGDADRRIRFHTAVALVPSGEPWAVRLLVADMDEERSEETRAARRSLGRLPSSEARRFLEEMVGDGTANSFAVEVLVDLTAAGGGSFDDRIRRRAWELIAHHLDSSPVARRIASKLDWPEAARDVCSRLP